MRKIRFVPLILLLAMLLLVMTACTNTKAAGADNTCTVAQILLPDGSLISGAVESWTYYSHSGLMKVKVDGVTYLVCTSNCALIAK